MKKTILFILILLSISFVTATNEITPCDEGDRITTLFQGYKCIKICDETGYFPDQPSFCCDHSGITSEEAKIVCLGEEISTQKVIDKNTWEIDATILSAIIIGIAIIIGFIILARVLNKKHG